jgi:uncharacterized protein
MSIEENKQFVRNTWEAFARGEIRAAFANMSDEISWLIPASLAADGPMKGKQAILSHLKARVASNFPKGVKSEIRRVYGDGDAVIIEMTNRGETSSGAMYENEYCFIFELEAGKVRRVREYLDTAKVKDLLG